MPLGQITSAISSITGVQEDVASTKGSTHVTTTGAVGAGINRVIPLSSVSTRQRETLSTGFQAFVVTARTLDAYDFTATGTAAAVGTTVEISSYTRGTLVVSGLTNETISVTGLIGSAQTLATAAIRVVDLFTGAVTAASALGNGSYKLVDLAVHKLVFTKSAATENATVTLSLISDQPQPKEDDDPIKILINEPNTALADAMLAIVPAAGTDLPYAYIRPSDSESVRTMIMQRGVKATTIDFIPTAKHTEIRFQGA